MLKVSEMPLAWNYKGALSILQENKFFLYKKRSYPYLNRNASDFMSKEVPLTRKEKEVPLFQKENADRLIFQETGNLLIKNGKMFLFGRKKKFFLFSSKRSSSYSKRENGSSHF